MDKINITIPDNLTPGEEYAAILKQLGKKMLPENLDPNKRIGAGYEVQYLETQINIKREPIEKPLVTRECSVCLTIFDDSVKFPLFVNYGGKTKKLRYCSDGCRDQVIFICGEHRAVIKRKDLKPIRLYN